MDYGINCSDHLTLKLYNLLKNIEVTEDDILDLIEDGYEYSEEEVVYLKAHLLDLTTDLLDYLIDECTQDMLDEIISNKLDQWRRDQSNITS